MKRILGPSFGSGMLVQDQIVWNIVGRLSLGNTSWILDCGFGSEYMYPSITSFPGIHSDREKQGDFGRRIQDGTFEIVLLGLDTTKKKQVTSSFV